MTSNKHIFKITYPILLTLVAQNIINVTNTAFLGRVGEVELGASAIGGVFYFAIYMIGFGFSQGAQILIGRRNGEKNYGAIGVIFNNALLFNIILSALIFAISVKGVPVLMKLAVSSQPVYEASVAYLDWRIYAYIFAFAGTIFRSFYVGITETRILTISAILMAVTNIVFDYVLIFGHWGFPAMGIEGAGISSVIAEVVTLVYIVIYTVYREDLKKYGLFKFKKVELKTILQILDLSIFIMFQYFMSISTWFMFFVLIEHTGERNLAISNIGRGLYILLMIPASALATTANTLVSNLIGAARKEEVVPFINKMARISIIVVFPFATFAYFFPELCANIYTDDASLILASIDTIKVVALANFIFAAFFIVLNGVSGTGNTRTAFFMEVITLICYICYVYYTAISNPQPIYIVWMSEFVYWTIIGLLGYWYLLKGNWRKKEI